MNPYEWFAIFLAVAFILAAIACKRLVSAGKRYWFFFCEAVRALSFFGLLLFLLIEISYILFGNFVPFVRFIVAVFIAAVCTYLFFGRSATVDCENRKEHGGSKSEVQSEAKTKKAVTVGSPPERGRLHFYGIDPRPDPSTGKRLKRGIYASDRVHTLIVGRTGYGKTRLLLSMIKQHIDNDEGFMVIDTHRDLAPLVLSHIPPEKAHKVIYINPMTAFDKRRVVQINFLEYKDPGDRDIIARLFMDSLEKIYERWWGPRLDMILLNALYLLMEREGATLP